MEADSSEPTRITVLSAGGLIYYVIPSFPVFNATLREVAWEDEYGKVHVFDGFACHCDLLDHQLPAVAQVPYSYDNVFMIEVRKLFNMLHNEHQFHNYSLFH